MAATALVGTLVAEPANPGRLDKPPIRSNQMEETMPTHVAVITVGRDGRTEVSTIACPAPSPWALLTDVVANGLRRLRAWLRTSTA